MPARPAPIRGLAAGIAGGLIASFAMDQFQKMWSVVLPPPKSDGDPATVKAAERASRAAFGTPLAKDEKSTAGGIVHYLFGAGLGGAYGLLAEIRPGVTRAAGVPFGLTTATLFDEIAVPAVGLGPAPTKSPTATHAYAYASHLVFGAVTEGVRRALRAR